MTSFTPDVLPKLLIELRDDTDVADIVGANPSINPPRVRGVEPAQGDSQGADNFRAFVVLVQLDATRLPRVPVQRVRIVARCYGRTPKEAADLRWACSNALHERGPRLYASGLGVYLTRDDVGGDQQKDPSTQQPYQTFIIEAFATTQAVATGS